MAPPASSSKPPTKNDLLATLDRIREKIEVVDKREQFQLTKVAAQTEEARARLAQGDKRRALQSVARRRQLERNVEQLAGMRSRLEELVMSIETGMLAVQVQHGLQEGLAAHKRLGVDPDEVHELHMDIEEELQKIEEAAGAMAAPLLGGNDNEEEDVLRDLAELELQVKQEQEVEQPQAGARKSLANRPAPPAPVVVQQLPAAPTHLPVVVAAASTAATAVGEDDDDEAELNRLEREMAM